MGEESAMQKKKKPNNTENFLILIVTINTKTRFSMQKIIICCFVLLYTPASLSLAQFTLQKQNSDCSYYSKKSSEEKSANSF